MFKVRVGVQNSQWADEMPTIITFATEAEFLGHVKEAKAKAEKLRQEAKHPLPVGTVISVDDDDETVLVDVIVGRLERGTTTYRDWLCPMCLVNEGGLQARHNPEGCGACEGGFEGSANGRFIHEWDEDNLYIVFTRYYEPQE